MSEATTNRLRDLIADYEAVGLGGFMLKLADARSILAELEAGEALAKAADFVLHDRDFRVRCEDSVIKKLDAALAAYRGREGT